MILTHKVEHKGDKLRVTFELPLSEVITHTCAQEDRLQDPLYRTVAAYLIRRIPDDIWDVAAILVDEGEVGHIKWFDDRKGFGFIRTYDKKDVFVHHSQIVGDGYHTVEQGQQVRFKRRFISREGREVLEAVDVEPLIK